jgi:hypothetical protein
MNPTIRHTIFNAHSHTPSNHPARVVAGETAGSNYRAVQTEGTP